MGLLGHQWAHVRAGHATIATFLDLAGALATATAAIAIVVHAQRPVVEPPFEALMAPVPAATRGHEGREAGISLQFGPRPRSLKSPARGPEGRLPTPTQQKPSASLRPRLQKNFS